MNRIMKEFYVYTWYYKDTNEVFYVGKGKGKRYCDKWNHRNQYFKNITRKDKDNVDVKIIISGLSESEAFQIEKETIREYWNKGQCKANLHEGGCGGNTGNYNNPERSRRLSEFGRTRTGSNSPMWGKTHTEETKEYLRQINLGKKLTVEQYNKMMDKDCPYLYEVFLNKSKVYECLGHSKLWKYCKEEFHISRTIIDQIISGVWIPKFQKHQHLSSLEIIKTKRSVQTSRDECSGVE